jgi:hypothetical protein
MFEDKHVVDLDRQLVAKLFYKGLLPRQTQRNLPKDARALAGRLSRVIRQNTRAKSIWAVKDPRITLVHHAWTRALSDAKQSPIYIFCYRDPREVVASMVEQYGMDQVDAEYAWLVRTGWFFSGIGAPVITLPYDEWLRRPKMTLLGLLKCLPLKPNSAAILGASSIVDIKHKRSKVMRKLNFAETTSLYQELRGADQVVQPGSELAGLAKAVMQDILKWSPVGKELYRLADSVK